MTKKLLAAALFLLALAPLAPTDDKDEKPTKDIVEIAVGAGKFDTLVAAVKAADLVDTLKSEGPFTVFAPTDEAFKKVTDKLGEEKTKELLKDKKALTKILLAHVVQKKAVLAEDVVKLDGKKLPNGYTVNVKDGKVTLTYGKSVVKVLKTDIKAKNGVIHVIDTVLDPDATPKKGKKKSDDSDK